MNWRCVRSDLAEARDQLNAIIAKLDAGDAPPEQDYLVSIQHAFHHLNVAWNARRCPVTKYQNMSQRDFNRWGKFPRGKGWNQLHRATGGTVRR